MHSLQLCHEKKLFCRWHKGPPALAGSAGAVVMPLPEHVGLVVADDRIRAKHQFKFRAVGSSTQAFRHSFAVQTVGDWNSLPSHVVEQSTPASFKAELSTLKSAAYAP